MCGSDSIERDHLRRLFAFMDTHSLRPRLHTVLPLHVRIAVKHDAFTRDSHSPIQEAASAHEIVESRGVQGRVVLDVDSACWE